MPIPPPATHTAFSSGISAMGAVISSVSVVVSPSGPLVFTALKALFTDGEGIIPCKLSAARRTFSRIAAALGFQDTADLFLCLMALLCKIFSLNRQPRLPGKLEVQIQHTNPGRGCKGIPARPPPGIPGSNLSINPLPSYC